MVGLSYSGLSLIKPLVGVSFSDLRLIKPLVGVSYFGLSQIKLLVGVSYSGISHIKTIIWSIILRSQSETNHWLEYHTEVSIDQNHTAVSVRSKPLVGVSNSYSGRSLSGNILLLTTTTR